MVRLVAFSNPRAALVSLYPGFDARLIDAYVAMDFRGLVLQAFGQGNGPTDTPAFASALQRAVERGVVVCAVTECLRGATVTAYGTGLDRLGVVLCANQTPECSYAKLCVMLSRLPASPKWVRVHMKLSLRGEADGSGIAQRSKLARRLN
jgi:L-asparaginase/Glu-tRNA(Gln) amidotransferase subunit D